MNVRIERNPRDGSAYFYPENGDVAILWCPRDLVPQMQLFFEQHERLTTAAEVIETHARIRNLLMPVMALVRDDVSNAVGEHLEEAVDAEKALAEILKLLGPVR